MLSSKVGNVMYLVVGVLLWFKVTFREYIDLSVAQIKLAMKFCVGPSTCVDSGPFGPPGPPSPLYGLVCSRYDNSSCMVFSCGLKLHDGDQLLSYLPRSARNSPYTRRRDT